MKVFASAIAITAVVAQDTAGEGGRGFDYGGFDTYDLSAFDDSYGFGGDNYYGFDENAYADNYGVDDADAVGAGRESEVAADGAEEDDERKGERYFFTTSATTTSTTTTTTTTLATGTQCWKCDAMTYSQCASAGSYQLCPLGDKDCCFVEIREENQALQQLCTGCKDKTACKDNQAENFNPVALTDGENVDQCRPDYRQQRMGKRENNQSVCRQCFQACDPSAASGNCFGGIVANTGVSITFPLSSDKASYPWTTAYTGADFVGLGIPTGYRHDTADTSFAAAVADIEAKTSNTLNLYFANAADGKLSSGHGNGDGTVDENEMIFWGLHGADKAWWSSDLKAIQTTLNALGNTGGAVANFQ